MSGVRVTVIFDDAHFRGAIRGLAARLGDLRPALTNIGQHLADSTRERFLAGVDPEGRRWKPHAPSTVRRRGAGAPVLRIHGQAGGLMGSITYRVEPDAVLVGTNKVYGAVHQLGHTMQVLARSQPVYQRIGRDGLLEPRFVKRSRSNFMRYVTIGAHTVTIPARPYLGVSKADRLEMLTILAEHLTPDTPGGGADAR